MREYFENVHKDRCTFFVSYHPQAKVKPSTFIMKIIEIYEMGYKIKVHYVDWDGYNIIELGYIERVRTALKNAGMELTANEDQQKMKVIPHTYCNFNRTLLGPDGKRYPCMKLLQEHKESIPLTHYEGIKCDREDCLCCNVEFILKENAWS